jgi:outer membrane receptor for ferrienterochelin and colicins
MVPVRSRRARALCSGLATLLGALLAPSDARADDDLEAMLEQSVVTTASQTAETKATAPATTSVITAEEIRRHGIRSLNEALNYLSLGMFTTNPLHGVEAGARGVLVTADFGNHILLLVDGHAVNEPYGGSASLDRGLGVPIELIDHVEVVLGPGSVLYGSNAMLGVVNVVTKRAKDYRGIRIIADSELVTWGKLAIGAGTVFDALGRTFEVTAQVEYQQQDGPTFTFAPQKYGNDAVTGAPKRFSPDGPATGIWGGRATSSYYSRAPAAYTRVVSGDLDVSLRASSFQRSSPYLDNLINFSGDFNDPHSYELEQWLFADVKYRIPVSAVVDVQTRVYADSYSYDWYNRSSAAEDCFDGQGDGCHRNLRARSKWVGTEVRGKFDWLKSGQLVSMIGVDSRYESVIAKAVTEGIGSGSGNNVTAGSVDVDNLRLGVYAQQTASPFAWLSLNAGARVDVAEGYPAAFSPRATAAVTPWKRGTLKAIYSEAFRAPSSYEREWEDLYALKAARLQPERARSLEASFEQQLGMHRLLFGAFSTRWRNLVTSTLLSDGEIAVAQAGGARIGASDVGQYRNSGEIVNYGYNAALEGSFAARRLRYGATVTGAYSRRDTVEGREPLSIAPSLYGNARVSYDLGGDLPTLALAVQFSGHRPTDGDFEPSAYAPGVLELRAAVTGAVPILKQLTYRVTANYAAESSGPYVIGPIQDGSHGVGPQLNPVDHFRAGVGLQYVWDP